MRQWDMNSINLGRTTNGQRNVIAQLGRRKNVRDLADFLGINPQVVAEGLVEAARRDPTLRLVAVRHHTAA
jgi:hypothetical protein